MEQLELFPRTRALVPAGLPPRSENDKDSITACYAKEPHLLTLTPTAAPLTKTPKSARLTAAGLFAGIGGIERGLGLAGHETELLCEIDPNAQKVLRAKFPDRKVLSDVRALRSLPAVDILAAGFPCQDLSQAGRTAGISGAKSGVVGEVFRLLSNGRKKPTWLLLENVPFMLQLERGRAMRFLTGALEGLGFRWAYRVVDARAFGLPQRRQRVILLASRTEDPRPVLFGQDASEPVGPNHEQVACGFYWTEGLRGLGWAVDSVPTLKGGSTIGIPSPPAIRLPHGEGIVTPEIRDVERLQGFPADWTLPALEDGGRKGIRWRLVGNAVNVRVSEWVGSRLVSPCTDTPRDEQPLAVTGSWPRAAWGESGLAYSVELSTWPVARPAEHLLDFLQYPCAPLSERATAGFLDRTKSSCLRFPNGFLAAIERHLASMRVKSK